MREFNIFGPINPKRHYYVNRIEIKAAIWQKIEKGRYFALNAAPQIGKTGLKNLLLRNYISHRLNRTRMTQII